MSGTEDNTEISIGNGTIPEVTETTYEYDVSLRGHYKTTEERDVLWPPTVEWDERDVIHHEDDLDSDTVIDIEVLDIESGGRCDTYTIVVTRKKWFAIGDEFTTDEPMPDTFDTAYFEELLTDVGIPPEDIIGFEWCDVTESRTLYRHE